MCLFLFVSIEFTPQHNCQKLVSIFECCNRETGSVSHVSYEFHHPSFRDSFEAGALENKIDANTKKRWYIMGKEFRNKKNESIVLSSRHSVKSSNIKCSNAIEKQKIESLKEEYDNFVLVQWKATEGSSKRYFSYNFENPIDTEAFCSVLDGRTKETILKEKYPKVYEVYKNAMRNRSKQIPVRTANDFCCRIYNFVDFGKYFI